MNKTFAFFVISLILLGAGCTTVPTARPAVRAVPVPTQPTKPMPTANLRTELETTYRQTLEALKNKDLDAFLAINEPAKKVNMDEIRANWSDMSETLLSFYPDLSTTRFLKVEQVGDWAGYYIQTDLEDANFLSISLLKFHRVGDVWKLFGSNFGTAIDRPADHSQDQAAIDQELKTNPGYRMTGE